MSVDISYSLAPLTRVEEAQNARLAAEQKQQEKAAKVAAIAAEREEARCLLAFYEGLTEEAKMVVNRRVEIELGEALHLQRITRKSVPWNAAMFTILRDAAFRDALSEPGSTPALVPNYRHFFSFEHEIGRAHV